MQSADATADSSETTNHQDSDPEVMESDSFEHDQNPKPQGSQLDTCDIVKIINYDNFRCNSSHTRGALEL